MLMLCFTNVYGEGTPLTMTVKGGITVEGVPTFNAYPGMYDFAMPDIWVYHGEEVVTSRFNFTYSIAGGKEGTKDGMKISTDDITGSSITISYGKVIIGENAGEFTVNVTATPKTKYESLYEAISGSYKVKVATIVPDAQLPTSAITIGVKKTGKFSTSTNKYENVILYTQHVKAPAFNLTSDVTGGTLNVTDHYTYDLAISGGTTAKLADLNAAKVVQYYIEGEQSTLSKEAYENLIKVSKGDLKLVYTFKVKDEYAKNYTGSFTKEIPLNIIEITEKRDILTSFDEFFNNYNNRLRTVDHYQDIFGEEVNDADSIYHIYKYPDGTERVMPVPTIKDSEGNDLSNSIYLAYEIVKTGTLPSDADTVGVVNGRQYGTYYIAKDGEYAGQQGGRVTGLGLYNPVKAPNENKLFQPGYPGRTQIKVTPFIYQTSKAIPEMYNVVGEGSFYNNPVYIMSNPVYFDIDVKQREPSLVLTPDPASVNFGQNDTFVFPERFEVTGKIGNELEGNAETLHYGDWDNGFTYSYAIPAFFDKDYYDSHPDIVYSKETTGNAKGPVIKVGNWPTDAAPEAYYDDYTYIDDETGETKTIQHVLWLRRTTRKDWGNERKWSLTFLEKGDWTIAYVIRPWNMVKWDIGHRTSKNYAFHVGDGVRTHIVVSPQFNSAKAGNIYNQADDYFVEPVVKVITELGKDVTKYFDIKYKIEDKGGSNSMIKNTWNDNPTSESNIRIGSAGTVKVKVLAIRNTSQTNYGEVHYGDPDNQDNCFYYIDINADRKDVRDYYEIISSNEAYNSKEKHTGKLHFISPDGAKAELASGFTIQGIPGMITQFGNYSEDDVWTIQKGVKNPEDDGRMEICDGKDETYGAPFILSSTSPVQLDEDNVPVSGAFIKLIPLVNGFVRLDGRFEKGAEYTILKKELNGTLTPHVFTVSEKDYVGEYTVGFPLLADCEYYIYTRSTGMFKAHGIGFDPAYIYDENTTKNTEIKAATFMNGYKGQLPFLANDEVANVTYSSEKVDKVVVDEKTGVVSPKGISVPDYIKITGSVTSSTKSDIKKTASYMLLVSDIPTYQLSTNPLDPSGELKDSYDFSAAPGDVVTTYNIPTKITMTYGGWQEGMQYTNLSGKNYADKFTAKSDMQAQVDADDLAKYNKYLDGFSWSTYGNNNPLDECFNGYNSYNWYNIDNSQAMFRNTFSIPCYGTFLKFEPEESGTLFIYLVQNGVCQYTGKTESLSNIKNVQLKWTPLYIVDESGRPAAITNDINSVGNYLAPTSEQSQKMGTYTEGLVRAAKDDQNVVNKGWKNGVSYSDGVYTTEEGVVYDWSKFSLNNSSSRAATVQQIKNHWGNEGERQTMIPVTSGGYTLISKAYVRYAVNVKAGKSYFVFQNGSKFGLCGFAFLPTGYPVASTTTKKELKLSDDMSLNQSINAADYEYGETADVTLQRTFTNNKWASICLPFSVSETQFKKIFGPNANLITYTRTENDGRTAIFTKHSRLMIEAARPYFVKPGWTEGDNIRTSLKFENVTLEETYNNATSGLNGQSSTIYIEPSERRVIFAANGFEFVGTYNGEEMPQYSYFIGASDGKLYRNNVDGAKIGHYRAYMKNPEKNANYAKLGDWSNNDVNSEEGTLTAVGEVYVDRGVDEQLSPQARGIYRLDGVKVCEDASMTQNLPAGVYIRNGKKYVVK